MGRGTVRVVREWDPLLPERPSRCFRRSYDAATPVRWSPGREVACAALRRSAPWVRMPDWAAADCRARWPLRSRKRSKNTARFRPRRGRGLGKAQLGYGLSSQSVAVFGPRRVVRTTWPRGVAFAEPHCWPGLAIRYRPPNWHGTRATSPLRTRHAGLPHRAPGFDVCPEAVLRRSRGSGKVNRTFRVPC